MEQQVFYVPKWHIKDLKISIRKLYDSSQHRYIFAANLISSLDNILNFLIPKNESLNFFSNLKIIILYFLIMGQNEKSECIRNLILYPKLKLPQRR